MVVYLTVHTLSVTSVYLNKLSMCKIAVITELFFCASDIHWLLCHYQGGLTKNLQVAVNAYSIYKYTHTYLNCTENSCQQKSIGLKFSKSQTGSDVRYSCHHNSSRFTSPIFAHSCRFSVLHSLQSITTPIY